MTDLQPHCADPAEFKGALIATLAGGPLSHRVAFAMPAPDHPVVERAVSVAPAGPAHWDAALLHQVQVALARHIGPIAAVLVRRSAPACHDLHTLCERLAEQVTSHGRERESAAAHSQAPVGTSVGPIPGPLIDASAQVLSRYLGPIAPLLARRAAAVAPDRAGYFGALEEAVPDPEQRSAVRSLLDKLH